MENEKLKCEKCGELFSIENLTKFHNHIFCRKCKDADS